MDWGDKRQKTEAGKDTRKQQSLLHNKGCMKMRPATFRIPTSRSTGAPEDCDLTSSHFCNKSGLR